MNQIINNAQLQRIEATHRGFLYQHLYAVACFLLAPKNNISLMRIEWDEDIELRDNDGNQFYLQVKIRSNPITYSDIQRLCALVSFNNQVSIS